MLFMSMVIICPGTKADIQVCDIESSVSFVVDKYHDGKINLKRKYASYKEQHAYILRFTCATYALLRSGVLKNLP